MQPTFLSNLDPHNNNYDTRRIGLLWLVKLRWWAVAGQILTVAIGSLFFHLSLPILAVSMVIAIEIMSNTALAFRLHVQESTPPRHLLTLTLYGDIALLTALLYITGGTMNPFTFLYLVHITLGAILLPPPLAWGLSISTTLFYGGMFLPQLVKQGVDTETELIQQVCNISNMNMDLHLQGMWFAYTVSAVLITFFASRIQQSLSDYHQTIAQLRHDKLQNDKLSALATLATGAAHELATPLATIALASGEMVYSCENKIFDDGLLEDAQLIREQTRRCKNILFQMSADAGAVQGEKYSPTTIDQLIDETMDMLGDIKQTIDIINKLPGESILVPSHAVCWALKGMLANAVDASPADGKIRLECKSDSEYIYFTVIDQGCGMTQEITMQAQEPFFTTKPVGKGMGLGLFLAKSLATQLEGALDIQSQEGEGTTVTMSFKKSLITPVTADMEV